MCHSGDLGPHKVPRRPGCYEFLAKQTGLQIFPTPFSPEDRLQPEVGRDERALFHQLVAELQVNLSLDAGLSRFVGAWNERVVAEARKKLALEGDGHALDINLKTIDQVRQYHRTVTAQVSRSTRLALM